MVLLNLSSHLPPLDTQYSCITNLGVPVEQEGHASGWTERDGFLAPPATYLLASPSGPDEKGRIAPHGPNRQLLIEVSDFQLAADDHEGQ